MAKSDNRRVGSLERQNSDLVQKNKTLGDENASLKSKLKAKESEALGLQQALNESEKHGRALEQAAAVIEPEDKMTKMINTVFEKKLESDFAHVYLEGERASSAVEYFRNISRAKLEHQEREIAIRERDPAVVEAKERNRFKRRAHFSCLIVGLGLVVFGIVGIGLGVSLAGAFLSIGVGVPLALIGIVPYISATDADKLDKLSKLFKGTLDQIRLPGSGD